MRAEISVALLPMIGWGSAVDTEKTNHRHRRLLRARVERHAAATPPSVAMNSRRAMVIVIIPPVGNAPCNEGKQNSIGNKITRLIWRPRSQDG
jgi:hypothetical protein